MQHAVHSPLGSLIGFQLSALSHESRLKMSLRRSPKRYRSMWRDQWKVCISTVSSWIWISRGTTIISALDKSIRLTTEMQNSVFGFQLLKRKLQSQITEHQLCASRSLQLPNTWKKPKPDKCQRRSFTILKDLRLGIISWKLNHKSKGFFFYFKNKLLGWI